MVLAKQLTAGTFAGIAQVLVGQPLDTIKVRSCSIPYRSLEVGKSRSSVLS